MDFFAKRGARVSGQDFSVQFSDSTLTATNVIARFHERLKPRILLCAHWDTRPWADSDPDSSRRGEPVPGANDGASGVAVLMEITHKLAERTPLCGVDVVLFDAEDMGGRHGLDYALGSRHYVSSMTDPPAAVILLDLVGDADLDLPLERYSLDSFPEMAKAIWDAAGRIGLSQFRPEPHEYVYDDHVPFLQAGIPAVDIVDIRYEYWHTTADTPDKCSPLSLSAPGTLLLHLLYDAESPLPSILEGNTP
jgi:Zn-dependent M28 family amino/carboxypeptidase